LTAEQRAIEASALNWSSSRPVAQALGQEVPADASHQTGAAARQGGMC